MHWKWQESGIRIGGSYSSEFDSCAIIERTCYGRLSYLLTDTG
jgi:hypothetical protein